MQTDSQKLVRGRANLTGIGLDIQDKTRVTQLVGQHDLVVRCVLRIGGRGRTHARGHGRTGTSPSYGHIPAVGREEWGMLHAATWQFCAGYHARPHCRAVRVAAPQHGHGQLYFGRHAAAAREVRPGRTRECEAASARA